MMTVNADFRGDLPSLLSPCILPSSRPQSGLVQRFTQLSTGEGGVVVVQGTGKRMGTGQRTCLFAASRHAALAGLCTACAGPRVFTRCWELQLWSSSVLLRSARCECSVAPGTGVSQAASPAAGAGGSQDMGHFPAPKCVQTGHQTWGRALCFAVVCSLPRCLARQGLLATVTTKGYVKNPESKLIAHKRCHPSAHLQNTESLWQFPATL